MSASTYIEYGFWNPSTSDRSSPRIEESGCCFPFERFMDMVKDIKEIKEELKEIKDELKQLRMVLQEDRSRDEKQPASATAPDEPAKPEEKPKD